MRRTVLQFKVISPNNILRFYPSEHLLACRHICCASTAIVCILVVSYGTLESRILSSKRYLSLHKDMMLIETIIMAVAEHAGGSSPAAPAPPPGQWGPEHNLTNCNGKVLKSITTSISLASCQQLCETDPQCNFINHGETDPGYCTTLNSCTGTSCLPTPKGGDPGNYWWSVYAYGRTGAPAYPGCNAPPANPGPAVCPRYHSFQGKIDPAGSVEHPPLATENLLEDTDGLL